MSRTHLMSKTRFHTIWKGIKQRCLNSKSPLYKFYGGRGITICYRWLIFENFRDDLFQSYLEHCKKFGEKQTSLDRINTYKEYSLKNCKWATDKKQAQNTRTNHYITHKGKTQCIAAWMEEFKIKSHIVYVRIHRGWDPLKALITPKYGTK